MTDARGNDTETLVGDAELIAQVRDGDTGAYAVLYERHSAAGRGLARQLLRGDAEVDDAVAEAFTRVLSVIQRGGGPTDAFRPYLLTAVRNAAHDRGRGDKRQVATEDMESVAPGQPFVDPALEGLERSLIARAFLSLPERWQAVLWHTEIEGAKPAEVGPLLGMKANSVAALAYRAREGLRQAYLQMHLAGGAAPQACRPTIDLLGAYVRGGLAKRESGRVDTHMDGCGHCREVYAELMDVNVGLRGIVLPLFAGSGAAGYLAAGPGAVGGAGWNRMSKGQQQASAGGVAAAAVAAAVALALVSADEPVTQDTPSAAAPEAPPAEEDPPAPDSPDDPDAPEDPDDPDDPDSPDAPDAPDAPPEDDDEEPAPDDPAAPDDPDTPDDPEEEPEPQEAVLPADVPEEDIPVDDEFPAFAAGVDPVGSLLQGSDGIMVLDVRNIGQATADDVIADFTLPPGVTLVEAGGAGSALPASSGTGDWSCSSGGGGEGTCVLSGLGEGENATQFLDVRVDQGAQTDVPGSVTVSSGEVSTTVDGERGVATEGVAARYAAAGQVSSDAVGNTLMTCVEPEKPEKPEPWWPWPLHGWSHPGVPEGPDAPEAPEDTEPPAEDTEPLPEDTGDLSRAPADPGDGEQGTDPEQDPGAGLPGLPDTPETPELPGLPDPGDGSGPEEPDPGDPDAPDGEPPAETPDAPDAPEAPEAPETPEAPEEDADPDTGHPGPCAEARERGGEHRDNDHFEMEPLDRDHDPTTQASSSAQWEMPEGGSVLWAGLYFSGAGEPSAPTARVKGPGMASYTTVPAAEHDTAELPGYGAYQAFADVTPMVAEHGAGEWWVADVPHLEGTGVHAGWSLVVVLEDPTVDVHSQTMVMDDTVTVFQGASDAHFPVSGLLPGSVPGDLNAVAWEGDADLGGDQVTAGGTPLAPTDGHHGSAQNAFVSSSRGAVGDPFTFGTDVVRFDPVVGRDTDIRIRSDQDAVLVGAIALDAPMRR
ncbi:sigma-70 family RNA polymerase sigma factor [Nocardiopsis sp. HNM0947]|uniref:Sigma-70 family RNA polymerase sigma factor n=1 Tax=Nocardiopsis coralli TaxID=2772213 RepID=A0ABR9PD46_9ACTN|nr:sigma-70 family RNA polymerase sigma factor [Nocardiopsis coralli]MBE3001755.1 sigma-70 family RNA polymerase sigma factor [Nocardiopsis coralli]